MKYVVDTTTGKMSQDDVEMELYSDDAFEALSDLWLKIGWNQKYVYTFSWFGVPIIQLPDDMIRYQEVITELKPDVIVETGVAHGGSAVFAASLCKAIGRGRVIAIDINIREQNRVRIEQHPFANLITLIEGSSLAQDVVSNVKSLIKPAETVLVVLDSNHTYDHVLAELHAYAPIVTLGSYIVATDGIMGQLADAPRGMSFWAADNPSKAAADFVKSRPSFVIEEPKWKFNESGLKRNITHWPGAWLKRVV